MFLRSSKNNKTNVTLKDLYNRSSKQHNQAAHSRKLSKEETYKQSDVGFTVDYSPSNINEPRIKNYIEIERNLRIKHFIEIERKPKIKDFIHIEDPNLIHEEKRKDLSKGSWGESNKEAGSNSESEKRRDRRDTLNPFMHNVVK